MRCRPSSTGPDSSTDERRDVKVLAAMSGGVDSAVAAALAVEAGHDVTGVHLALADAPATLRSGSRGTTSPG